MTYREILNKYNQICIDKNLEIEAIKLLVLELSNLDGASFLAHFDDELPVLAVDGSKIQIPTNPDDVDSFMPGSNGQKPYNLLLHNSVVVRFHQV